MQDNTFIEHCRQLGTGAKDYHPRLAQHCTTPERGRLLAVALECAAIRKERPSRPNLRKGMLLSVNRSLPESAPFRITLKNGSFNVRTIAQV